MGRSLAGLLVLGACGFGPRATGDAAGSGQRDAPIDQHLGGGSDTTCMPQLGPVCGGKLWATDFSVDPTTIDHNCDGVADFHMRQGGPMPGAINAGIWSEPGTPSLAFDTQPLDPFLKRTIVRARMRNTQLGAVTARGAVVWINVGFDGTNLGVIFVDLRLLGATQTATLYTKSNPAQEDVLAGVAGLDLGFHDIHLDIDPGNQQVSFAVDGMAAADYSFDQIIAGSNNDQFATLVADGTSSDFDAVSIERCP